MQFLTLLPALLSLASALPALSPSSGSSSSGSSSSGSFPSISELGWCLIPWHIPACIAANGHADTALSTAGELFPADSLHNGQGDAFRHCYWNARMAIDIGEEDAKTIADNHEDASDGPQAEKDMDLANNEKGRQFGASAHGNNDDEKYEDAKAKCNAAARDGTLKTLK